MFALRNVWIEKVKSTKKLTKKNDLVDKVEANSPLVNLNISCIKTLRGIRK